MKGLEAVNVAGDFPSAALVAEALLVVVTSFALVRQEHAAGLIADFALSP